MSEIDYQAIADEMRASVPEPRIEMEPGAYWCSFVIHNAARAFENVGKRVEACEDHSGRKTNG